MNAWIAIRVLKRRNSSALFLQFGGAVAGSFSVSLNSRMVRFSSNLSFYFRVFMSFESRFHNGFDLSPFGILLYLSNFLEMACFTLFSVASELIVLFFATRVLLFVYNSDPFLKSWCWHSIRNCFKPLKSLMGFI